VSCPVGNVGSGASGQVYLWVTAREVGSVVNTATVTSDADVDPSNNSATDSDTVIIRPMVDLSAEKSDYQTSATVGDQITYQVNFYSSSEDVAEDVVVTDVLPDGVTFVTASGGASGYSAPSSFTFDCSFDETTRTVTCDGADIGAYAYGYVSVTVTADEPGVLVNTATVSSANDPNLENNSATDDDTVVAAQTVVDLSITKTDGASEVTIGDDLVYTIIVTNEGDSPAQQVSVVDQLPADVLLVDARFTTYPHYYAYSYVPNPDAGSYYYGCPFDSVARSVTCTTPYDLGPGESLGIAVRVRSTVAGTLTNTATVTSASIETDPSDNTAADDTVVSQGQVDLVLSKDDGRTAVAPGEPFTYSIRVDNAGPDSAHNVVITDALPEELDSNGRPYFYVYDAAGNYVSSSYCSVLDDVVSCSVPVIPAGGSAGVYNVAVSAVAIGDGSIENTATVTSADEELVPADNTATDIDTIEASSFDLVVDKVDNIDGYGAVVGEFRDYTIYVYNNSSGFAGDVTVTDTLPEGMTFVSGYGSGGACAEPSPGVVTCPIGDVYGSYYWYWNYRYAQIRVLLTAEGTLTNTATAASAYPGEVDPSNDTDSTTLEVVPHTADLGVSVDACEYGADWYYYGCYYYGFGDPAVVGRPIDYRLTASNYGPGPADVLVVDDLPLGVEFDDPGTDDRCVYTDDRGSGGGHWVECTAPGLPDAPGGNGTDFVVRVIPTAVTDPGSPLVNTATISALDVPETNPANNTATESTDVVADTVDLDITNIGTGTNPVVVGQGTYYSTSTTTDPAVPTTSWSLSISMTPSSSTTAMGRARSAATAPRRPATSSLARSAPSSASRTGRLPSTSRPRHRASPPRLSRCRRATLTTTPPTTPRPSPRRSTRTRSTSSSTRPALPWWSPANRSPTSCSCTTTARRSPPTPRSRTCFPTASRSSQAVRATGPPGTATRAARASAP